MIAQIHKNSLWCWTTSYNPIEQGLVRNAIDQMLTRKYGPMSLRLLSERRDQIIRRLTKEEIDHLAKGASFTPPRDKKRNVRWNIGLQPFETAEINKVMQTKVLPFRIGKGRTSKNSLIQTLSKEELSAIKGNDQAVRKKIVERFAQLTTPEVIVKQRSSKKQI